MPKKLNEGRDRVPPQKRRTRDPMQDKTPTAGKRAPKGKERGGSGASTERAQCTAHKRNGDRCANPPVRGAAVCRMHGGAAPQVKAKANQRLIEMVLPALSQLRKIIDNPNTNDSDRIRAINAVLNRTGFSERASIDVGLREPTPWDNLATDAFTILRGEVAVAGDTEPVITESQREALERGKTDDYELDELAKLRRDDADRVTYLPGLDGSDLVVGTVVEGVQRPNLDPFNQESKDRARSNRPSEHDRDPQGTARRNAGSRLYEDEDA